MATITAFTTQEKASHNSHKFAFTLTPTNYGFWKAMLEPFLTSNNLLGYVNGTIPCPDQKLGTGNDIADNPNYSRWVTNDAHVRMIIISTISEASFQHVQGSTSRELWSSLERVYAPNNSAREYTLKTQLLKLNMKGDETPLSYLSRAQEYASALANIGEQVKDKDLVLLVIAGLREEYNGLKANLLARNPPVTFIELHSLLSDHDYLITKNISDPTSSQPHVFAASTLPNLTQFQSQLQSLQQMASQLGLQLHTAGSPTPPPQAFFASRPSHNNNNNFRGNRNNNSRGINNNNSRGNFRGGNSRGNNSNPPRQFAWASTQNMVYGHCNRCGIGHLPSQCPNNQGSNNSMRSGTPQANFATFSDHASTSANTWFPDTGANTHTTPDLSNLDTSEYYRGPDSLHVGDGRAYSQHSSHGTK